MAVTTYGVNDALAVKLWAKKLASEALKATPIAPLIGTSSSSIIHRKTETEKSAGDRVRYGLRMQLTGDGVTEGQSLEGNEEALTTHSDDVVINELAHAVRVRNKGTIDPQRVPFNLRDESKMGLVDWYAKRMSVTFFNQVCGYTPQSDTRYLGFNSVTAPSRKIFPASITVDEDLSAATTDVFNLNLIDQARELAETASVPIRPLMIGGEEKYVIYLHPYQVTDMRVSADTGQWFDIQKAAMQGGQVSKNPIYTGALGEYNGVIIRKAFDVTQGVRSDTGAAITTVRRAVFLGAQAACMAFGQGEGPNGYRWVEELFDYERELGVSVQCMFGMKKTIFNSEDFGAIVIPTYASSTHPGI